MKRSTIKRVLAMALTMALVLVFATSCSLFGGKDKDDDKKAADQSFIEELGGSTSETFKGALSEDTYYSVENAAIAYVEQEIAGESYAEIINVESKATFTPGNVDTEIPYEFLVGADSVEKVEVSYDISDATAMTLSSKSGSNQKIVVYIIKYGPDFKYFTPMPTTGSTVSKSYYNSVFDAEKYENCTFETTMTADASVKMKSQGENIDMTMTLEMYQLVKHADDRIYLEQRMSTVMKMPVEYGGNQTNTQTLYAYLEEVNGSLVCYVKLNEYDNWQRGYLHTIGFSNLEELKPFHDQYLDYSYFEKTDYGFVLQDKNAEAYFEQAFADVTDQLGSITSMLGDAQMDVDMAVKYYVVDGALWGMQSKGTVTMDMDMSTMGANVSVNLVEDVDCVGKVSNCGSTVVDRPESLPIY